MEDSRSKDSDDREPNASEQKPDEGLAELRDLLLAPQQHQLDLLKQRLDTAELQPDEVSKVLPEAVAIGSSRDKQLALALEPITTEAITSSIRKNRQVLVDAIFPVMGPAIRKAIATTLQSMLQSFNQILENSMSLRGLKWRLEALRTDKSFAEVVLLNTLVYQVEQVFLIHRDTGLLLQNVAVKTIVAQDPDLVSGMLSAIQDFVHDSFGASDGAKLETLRVGEQNVWIEQGRHAILAAVIRGNPPVDLQVLLKETLDEIRFLMGDALGSFEGDVAPFEAARPTMENCLVSQFIGAERKTPVMPLVIIGLVLIAAGVFGFWLYRSQSRWSDFITTLRQQPGIVVTSVQKDDGKYRIGGLRDPYAVDPAELLAGAGYDAEKVEFQWEPFHSLHPPYAGKRLADILRPPETVTYRLENGILRLDGTATRAWLKDARYFAGMAPWIKDLDESGLVTVEDALDPPAGVSLELRGTALTAGGHAPHHWISEMRKRVQALPGGIALQDSDLIDMDRARFEKLRQRIESASVLFSLGNSSLEAEQFSSLQALAPVFRELFQTAKVLDQRLVVKIIGHSDIHGSEYFNLMVSQERARSVLSVLLKTGLPAELFQTAGEGSNRALTAFQDPQLQAANRRVTFHLELFDPDPASDSN